MTLLLRAAALPLSAARAGRLAGGAARAARGEGTPSIEAPLTVPMIRLPPARSVVSTLRRLLAAAALACALLPGAARAQGTATIDLRVLDGEEGVPLAGATVVLNGVFRAVSDSLGRVVIGNLSPGRHVLNVVMLGRRLVAPEVELADGDVLRLEVVLDEESVELPRVDVLARPRVGPGIAGRPGVRGVGRWISREEIERSGAQKLSELLVMVGLMRPDGRMRGPRCRPTLFADGLALTGTNIDIFPVQDLEAVQVFSNGTAPPEFGGTSGGCGIVAVWTRHK